MFSWSTVGITPDLIELHPILLDLLMPSNQLQ